MEIFKCFIPGRPMVKKNGAKIYRGRQVLTPQYRAWEDSAILHVRMQASRMTGLPFNFKMRMRAVFYFKDHHAEADLSNLYEGIQDVLQKCEVIHDDKLIFSHDGSTKVFGREPRLEVTLFKIED